MKVLTLTVKPTPHLQRHDVGTQQTQHIELIIGLMLIQCHSVREGGPALNQHYHVCFDTRC